MYILYMFYSYISLVIRSACCFGLIKICGACVRFAHCEFFNTFDDVFSGFIFSMNALLFIFTIYRVCRVIYLIA